jgi:hypothetical protein
MKFLAGILDKPDSFEVLNSVDDFPDYVNRKLALFAPRGDFFLLLVPDLTTYYVVGVKAPNEHKRLQVHDSGDSASDYRSKLLKFYSTRDTYLLELKPNVVI